MKKANTRAKVRVLLTIALVATCFAGCQTQSARNSEVPVKSSSEASVETVLDVPVESPSEASVETVLDVPVESSSEASVETVLDVPVESSYLEKYAITAKKEVSILLPDGNSFTTDGGRFVLIIGENKEYYQIKFWDSTALVSKSDVELMGKEFIFDPLKHKSEGIVY